MKIDGPPSMSMNVFTTSPSIRDMYRQSIDLRSTGIDSPIDWSEVEAPEEMRRFVTFVNPSMAKGAMLFARLADMLGASPPPTFHSSSSSLRRARED